MCGKLPKLLKRLDVEGAQVAVCAPHENAGKHPDVTAKAYGAHHATHCRALRSLGRLNPAGPIYCVHRWTHAPLSGVSGVLFFPRVTPSPPPV